MCCPILKKKGNPERLRKGNSILLLFLMRERRVLTTGGKKALSAPNEGRDEGRKGLGFPFGLLSGRRGARGEAGYRGGARGSISEGTKKGHLPPAACVIPGQVLMQRARGREGAASAILPICGKSLHKLGLMPEKQGWPQEKKEVVC